MSIKYPKSKDIECILEIIMEIQDMDEVYNKMQEYYNKTYKQEELEINDIVKKLFESGDEF